MLFYINNNSKIKNLLHLITMYNTLRDRHQHLQLNIGF